MHVVGAEPAAAVLSLAEYVAGDDRVGAVIVRAHDPSVVPQGREDRNGIVDLPVRRVVAAALIGAILGFGAGLLVGSIASTDLTPALVLGGFAAVVGGVIGFVLGGGARYGSERAISQPQAAGRDIAIVAAFLDDEHAAASLARTMAETQQQYDLRIVGHDGRWHVPNS